jgi:hypothetical protein
MSLYVVYFCGRGTMPAEDVQKIRQHVGVQVVNDRSARALLLDLEEPAADFLRHVEEMDDWVVSKQETYHVSG